MDPFLAILLSLHNLWRWVVLVMAVLAVVTAYLGWFGKRPWTERQRKIGSFTAMSLDIQFLLGLILYFISEFGFKGLGKGMEFVGANRDYRFFGTEHLFYMVVALVFAHLGSILPKRVQDDKGKYIRAAVSFTVMLLLLLVGIPWWRPLLRLP